MAKKGGDEKRMHNRYAETGEVPGIGSIYERGRPAKFAKGGAVVDGVRQRAGIAMGGAVSGKAKQGYAKGGKFQKLK